MSVAMKIAGVTLLKYWRKIEGYMYVPMFNCITVPWTPDLQPSVALNKNCAYIVHCWFDAWKGLIQMKWKVMYNKRTKRIVGFHLENEKVLVEYMCGIHY